MLEIRSFISSVLLKGNQSAFPLCCQSHITHPSLLLISTKGQCCCLGRKMLLVTPSHSLVTSAHRVGKNNL